MCASVAICFHLGYYNRFKEFTPYIDNVIHCCAKADIYITYREDISLEKVIELCCKKYPRAHIMKATNGCDTGAFLLQIKAIITSGKDYDYVFKIHTKSSNDNFTNWTQELLHKTAGSYDKVNRVLQTFESDHKIGMIGGKKWVLQREIDYPMFREICTRNKIIPDGYFIGGTIFWVRTILLHRIFKSVDIDFEYSLCEKGKPNEPSYTHAWERIYGLIVSTCGCYIKGL